MKKKVILFLGFISIFQTAVAYGEITNIQVGARPFYLIESMSPQYADLQNELRSCSENTLKKTNFSIAHRGAPLQYPEHTRQSYLAAARMGAGIIECDVALTKDKELVCRHSDADLHTTTDILLHRDLAKKCTQPFIAADLENNKPAQAECRTTDITLAEFKTLKGKMDAANKWAQTVEEYVKGTTSWRTDLYNGEATLMTHKQSIELFDDLNVKMTPELKRLSDDMPFDSFTYDDYRQKLIDEYKSAGINPKNVYIQSFNKDDVLYVIENAPEFAPNAVYLIEDMVDDVASLSALEALKAQGVKIVAPALPMLVTQEDGNIVASQLAKDLKYVGFDIIAWSLERSEPLPLGGGWYYNTTQDISKKEGDIMKYLDVIAKDIGVIGVFSDWPATTTYYGNCMGL